MGEATSMDQNLVVFDFERLLEVRPVDKRMLEIEIRTNEELGVIEIEQCESENEMIQIVSLAPEQVDTVVEWLRQAKSELESE